jgi:hypothetical protein
VTKPLPFTEASVRRAVVAARKAGIEVSALSVSPDGTVTVYQGIAPPQPLGENHAKSKWLDVEA